MLMLWVFETAEKERDVKEASIIARNHGVLLS